MKKAIVLAANYQYIDQVTTTIKSLFSHNTDINLYLINSDFPTEWFENLNHRLKHFNSEVFNCRVSSLSLDQYKTDISYTVFLRYFVPDFVKETRALYLDCDIVIKDKLDCLFEMDMENFPVAAVKDQGARVYFAKNLFNAGVLLIDTIYWKENHIKDRLISLTNELHEEVDMADQSILNLLFENNWLELSWKYNFIPNHVDFIEDCDDSKAVIIHYLTHRKPWDRFVKQLRRKDWWLYNGLDWSEVEFMNSNKVNFTTLDYQFENPSCFIFTNSGDIEKIEELIEALPKVTFIIASQVAVGDYLARLLKFPNVKIYSAISDLAWIQRYLIETSSLLLDINYGEEVDNIISKFNEVGKPVFAFDSTKHQDQGQKLFNNDNVDQMVTAIESYLLGGVKNG